MQLVAEGQNYLAAQAAAQGRQLLHTYLRAQPSLAREGCAFWNHSGTGAYPGDWDRTVSCPRPVSI